MSEIRNENQIKAPGLKPMAFDLIAERVFFSCYKFTEKIKSKKNSDLKSEL